MDDLTCPTCGSAALDLLMHKGDDEWERLHILADGQVAEDVVDTENKLGKRTLFGRRAKCGGCDEPADDRAEGLGVIKR